MEQKKFISFDVEAKKVTISLTFDVIETDVKFTKKAPKISVVRNICILSLKKRMEHCQNVLTNSILPQNDKVFTSQSIFSNEIGKHFSIAAFETMEALEEKIRSTNEVLEVLKSLNDSELCQLLKAIAEFISENSDEQEGKEYLMSWLTEVAIMKGRKY